MPLEIRVSFATEPRIETALALEGREIIGLTRVSVAGQDILAAAPAGLAAPVMKRTLSSTITPITDVVAYLKERAETGERNLFPRRGELQTAETPLRGPFLGWRREGPWVVVDVGLPQGRAEWRLAAAGLETCAGEYAGVNWQLRLFGAGRVYEILVEEPVVFAEGDWRLQQRGSQIGGRNEEESRLSLRPGPDGLHVMSNRRYDARQQPFFFLAGSRGATLSYFEGISCADVGEAQRGNRIVLSSAIPVRAGTAGHAATPVKSWMFRAAGLADKWRAVNEWTWAWDRVIGDAQARYGVKPTEPLPTLFHQQCDTPGQEYGLTLGARKGMAPPPLDESWLYRFAEDIVPKAAAWGIGVIELRAVLDADIDHDEADCPVGSFATESVCSPWGLRISPGLGGEDGLAHLVRKAHERDIKVAIWSAPAHQSVCSPVVLAHPEWLMLSEDGRVNNRGYVTLVGMDLAAGFRAYLQRAYRRLRARTGVDGVWADSACAFGADRDMSDAAPYPQLEQVVRLQRAMQRMGYTVLMKEDCGPFGLSSRSTGLAGVLGHEYLRYYFLFNHADPTKRYDPDSYFRTLASKGIMEIRVPREFEALPAEARDRIVRANHAYREVLPLMRRRFVLGEGDLWQGVAWADRADRLRVLYSFAEFDWEVPRGARVRELMAGAGFRAVEGRVRALPWRIYVLDMPGR